MSEDPITWGMETKDHDNIYGVLTQGSVSMCRVITETVYHIKFNMGDCISCQRTINSSLIELDVYVWNFETHWNQQ